MIRSLWSAATGMQAQTLNIDVISNNLANVGTSGFKKSRAEFQDLLYQTLRSPGESSSADTQAPTGIQVGHGTRPSATQKIFSQGDFQNTENELDMAIEGDGFFQIIQPNGETAYSRGGSFKIDSEGRVVTSDGFPIEPELTVPTDTVALSIGTDGTVSVLLSGESEATEIGNIELAQFYESGRPEKYRKKPVQPIDIIGGCHHRNSGRRWIRHHCPGVPGNVQCECGGRDGQHDRGPAGL